MSSVSPLSPNPQPGRHSRLQETNGKTIPNRLQTQGEARSGLYRNQILRPYTLQHVLRYLENML